MASHGPGGAAARDRSLRQRSCDSQGGADGISSGFPSRSVSATRVRGRSVPAPNSPSAHRAGVDLRPFASSGSQAPAAPQAGQAQYMGTPPQSSTTPTLPQELPANQGGLDSNTVNLFRQMMQAQDEQIRAQASQVPQLTDLVKNLACWSTGCCPGCVRKWPSNCRPSHCKLFG